MIGFDRFGALLVRCWRSWMRHETAWHPVRTIRDQTLIDGTRDGGLLMRRRVNGQWQYRRPTDADIEAIGNDMAAP
jgi:hypothetical protein